MRVKTPEEWRERAWDSIKDKHPDWIKEAFFFVMDDTIVERYWLQGLDSRWEIEYFQKRYRDYLDYNWHWDGIAWKKPA